MKEELSDCPMCGSRDVGGSNNMAYCYNCGNEVRETSTTKAVDKWNTLADNRQAIVNATKESITQK